MSKNGNVDISAHCGPRNERFPSILGDKKRFENEEVQKRVFEASQVIVQSPLISPPLSFNKPTSRNGAMLPTSAAKKGIVTCLENPRGRVERKTNRN